MNSKGFLEDSFHTLFPSVIALFILGFTGWYTIKSGQPQAIQQSWNDLLLLSLGPLGGRVITATASSAVSLANKRKAAPTQDEEESDVPVKE